MPYVIRKMSSDEGGKLLLIRNTWKNQIYVRKRRNIKMRDTKQKTVVAKIVTSILVLSLVFVASSSYSLATAKSKLSKIVLQY
jgi:hypothetical protein